MNHLKQYLGDRAFYQKIVASGIITGHTIGEEDMKKAQRQGYTFLGLGFVLGCVAAGLILLLRGRPLMPDAPAAFGRWRFPAAGSAAR